MLPPLYPVNLVVAERPCLVVGGGSVATKKVAGLLECGASVTVVAPPKLTDQLGGRLAAGEISWIARAFERDDVRGAHLVIAATDDPAINAQVADVASTAGIWVNSVDDPSNCSFTLPASVRRGPLLATFSTGGTSPAMSSWMRRRYEGELGPEFLTLLEVLSEARERIRSEGRSTEGLDWQSALDSGMLEMIREGRLAEAKERLEACLSSSSD